MDTAEHRQDKSLPELLSPAGNLECALAAFDGGADAVYCGLGKFNARERARNFSSDDLGRLISFARRCGKKVYLACNTLVKESELAEVVVVVALLVLGAFVGILLDKNELQAAALRMEDP